MTASRVTLQVQDNVPSYPQNAINITASDATEYKTPMAVEVISTGDLVVEAFGNGTEVTVPAAPLGYRPGFLVKKVKAATTATVVGLY